MRLAQIILPEYDNDGNSVIHAHSYIQRSLSGEFGGYTSLRSQGGWIDPSTGTLHNEPGKVYQVAMEDTAVNASMLRGIARTAGRLARQKAVFVVYPSHEVEIISISAVEPIVIDSLTAMDEHFGKNLRFMHGLEDIKRLNNAALSPAVVDPDTDEVERATRLIALLRSGMGMFSSERNEAADLLASAYGIVED